VPPLVEAGRKKIPKRERYERLAARALADLAPWLAEVTADLSVYELAAPAVSSPAIAAAAPQAL